MIIHVFEDAPHHYKPMQRFFSEQCFVNSPQEFWVRANAIQSIRHNSESNAGGIFNIYHSNTELLSFLINLPNNAQIIFHGLNDIHLLKRLLFSPIVKQCSCVIWGYELYRYNKPRRTLKEYFVQIIHSIVLRRFAYVITLTPGDGELLKHYLKRDVFTVIPYPLIGVSKEIESKVNNQTNQSIKILVGNSAAKSNEHIDAFKQLAHLANENIEIIVPLNYANQDENYIATVIKFGQALFSAKFKPITEMLTKDVYDELLAEVNMAVFSHHRQQGLYVAYSMLLMGKPFFLRSDTTSYQNFESLGFDVQDLNTLGKYEFLPLKKLVSETNIKNQNLIKEYFTEQALAPKWSSMLNGLLTK